MNPMPLSRQEFEQLRVYIHKICGLYILDEKMYLVQQRLEGLVRQHACASFEAFYALLTSTPPAGVHESIIEAITTHETSFFRDRHPFDAFRDHLLPALGAGIKAAKAARNARTGRADGEQPHRARIWCAGASTGQEPYSLAMLVHDYVQANCFLGVAPQDFTILATDISNDVLAKAKNGVYSDLEVVRGLQPEAKNRYFQPADKGWRIRDEIRRIVDFRKMNLVEPFGMLTGFDCIFCRNVLIYFDDPTKKQIIEQFHRKLTDNGVLVLGSAENLYALTEAFESITVGDTILYRKRKM
ncbi:MAG: protein-glutamate O-methyltransferase CheR [Desulfovibrionaceae bacterium]